MRYLEPPMILLARIATLALTSSLLMAGNGPLGIDHPVGPSDTGLWKREVQTNLERGVIVAELVGVLSTQGDTRLGREFRAAVDSSVLTALTVLAAKRGFSRARPNQDPDPNRWFQGSGHESFPSGEVALQASFVTPFIAEYRHDHPWVWALEALPAYDAVARVKSRGHWQTDVLAGWAVGTAWGIWAHRRETPLVIGLLPGGLSVGYRKVW